MKRAVFLYLLMFILLAASSVAFSQSDAKPAAKRACAFNIAGLWRSDLTTESTPIFFSFSPKSPGHVTLLTYSSRRSAPGFRGDNSFKL